MKSNRLCGALLAAVLLGAPVAGADETMPSPEAMAFAGQFSDAHLGTMLSRIGSRDPRLVAASQIDGQLLAIVLDAQIAEAVETHGDAWQRNMALVWSELLDDDQLASLTAEGAESPHAAAYGENSAEAGQRMQARSGEMFQEILGDVLEQTLAELTETQ